MTKNQKSNAFDVSNSVRLAFELGGLLGALCTSGCAVHYYDKTKGTEHVWGFGHIKMKCGVPNEDLRSIVSGAESLGLSIHAGQEDYHLAIGWESRRRIQVGTNASVRLEWPSGDFFKVRIGSKPSFLAGSLTNQPKQEP